MQVDFSKLHEAQPFTQEYAEALIEYQNQGYELPDYLFLAIQTQAVLSHLPLELPFSEFEEGVWVRLGSFLEDFKAYKADPESAGEAWYYAVSDHVLSSSYAFLHATGIWK